MYLEEEEEKQLTQQSRLRFKPMTPYQKQNHLGTSYPFTMLRIPMLKLDTFYPRGPFQSETEAQQFIFRHVRQRCQPRPPAAVSEANFGHQKETQAKPRQLFKVNRDRCYDQLVLTVFSAEKKILESQCCDSFFA
jgi:hypothetical protein